MTPCFLVLSGEVRFSQSPAARCEPWCNFWKFLRLQWVSSQPTRWSLWWD